LLTFMQQHVIRPLLGELASSDAMWQQVLSSQGWELTANASSNTAASSFQFHQQQQQQQLHQRQRFVSILDPRLPSPLCDDMQAVRLWEERQQLERSLFNPNFEVSAAHRNHVLARLQLWARQGILCDGAERSCGVIPTDGHILENLMLQWLNRRCNFTARFLPSGGSALRKVPQSHPSPPFSMANGGSYGGLQGFSSSSSSSTSWPMTGSVLLRQVSNQLLSVKPQPEYELEACGRSWAFSPSPTNFLEAIALMLILHVADDVLPTPLVQAAEVALLPGGIGNLFQMLPSSVVDALQALRSSCPRRRPAPWASASSTASASSANYAASAFAASCSPASSSTLPFAATAASGFPQPSAPPLPGSGLGYSRPADDTGSSGLFQGGSSFGASAAFSSSTGSFAAPFGGSRWAAAPTITGTAPAASSSSSSMPGHLSAHPFDRKQEGPGTGAGFGLGTGFGNSSLFGSSASTESSSFLRHLAAASSRTPPPAPVSSPVSATGSEVNFGSGFGSGLGSTSATLQGVGLWGSRGSSDPAFQHTSLFAGFGVGDGHGSFASQPWKEPAGQPSTSENVDMTPVGW